MRKSQNHYVGRRGFLKGAAASAAAFATKTASAQTQQSEPRRPAAVPPNEAQLAADTVGRPATAAALNSKFIESPGSDHMVDIIKALGIEYVAANPGSSFEGLH